VFLRKTCRAIRPRLRLAFEKIQIVRRDRGTEAAGDVILKSAQKALQFNDPRSALQDLENFERFVRDVSPVHSAVLATARFRLSRKWCLNLPPPQPRDFLILIFELFRWLMTRHPLSCQQIGLFRLHRCTKLSNILIFKRSPPFWGFLHRTYWT
jgi:hypothetical protein